MTDLEKVKLAYTKLSYSDRAELRKFASDYEEGTTQKQKTFSEGLENIRNRSLGPTSSAACLYCGK